MRHKGFRYGAFAMTNKIKIDLELTGEQATARGLDHAGDKVEDFGDDLKQAGKDADFLTKRLAELRGGTRALAAQFAITGDEGILKDLKSARRELAELEKIKKSLTPEPGPGGRGILGSLGDLGGDIRGAMGAAKGPAIAGAVVLGAAISPFIGSAIAAGVLGAAGAGGIAGGIAAAARDPMVRDEAGKLGGIISSAFTEAGKPVVAPLLESIRLLEQETGDSADKMRTAFGTIAPVLLPLTRGLDGLIDEAMPGLIEAMSAAKPILRVVADELPEVGRALTDFFHDVSEDPDGAIMAMKALFQITNGTIRATGELVGTLEQAYEDTQRWGIGAANTVAKIAEVGQYITPVFGLIGKGALQARDNYQAQVDAINRAKDASKDFRGITQSVVTSQYELGGALVNTNDGLERQRMLMLGLVDSALDLRRSTQDIEAAIDSFTEAVDENGKSLDAGDPKGRRNIDTIDAGIDALRRGEKAAYDHAVATGATTLQAQEAAAAYRAQWIPALEKAATSAGFNADQVRALLAELDRLDGKQVSYKVIQQGGRVTGIKVQGGTLLADNNIDGRASGGAVYPGQTYRVGENGVELLEMGSTGGYVHNAAQTAAMASAPQPAAMPPLKVEFSYRPSGDQFFDTLMTQILKYVRINGGDLAMFGAEAFPSHHH